MNAPLYPPHPNDRQTTSPPRSNTPRCPPLMYDRTGKGKGTVSWFYTYT